MSSLCENPPAGESRCPAIGDGAPPCPWCGSTPLCGTLSEAWRALELAEAAAIERERQAHQRGRGTGYGEGWRASEASMAAAWHAMAHPVAYPVEHAREAAARCLRAAEAGARQDAADHERAFVARAYNTRPDQRTDPQAAAVLLYPPPARTGGAA